jgi:hypothetical protein
VFDLGNKKTYKQRIASAIETDSLANAVEIASDAFNDAQTEEDVLAWIAAVMYEKNIQAGFDLIQLFVKRFPNSLHLPRIYLAELLSRASRFDETTDHARHYLRLAQDSGVLSKLSANAILNRGVSHAFLLLTSAYTELGARSYSKRVLERGLCLGLTPDWEHIMKEEMKRLEQELLDQNAAATDQLWESFFTRGKGADEVFRLCTERGFQLLAKRVDLLEGNFRFNADFRVDDQELLLLTFITENNVYLLR